MAAVAAELEMMEAWSNMVAGKRERCSHNRDIHRR